MKHQSFAGHYINTCTHLYVKELRVENSLTNMFLGGTVRENQEVTWGVNVKHHTDNNL